MFDELAVTTDAGTVIEGATLKAVETALDAYYFHQRTGVMIMEISNRLPIKKIAERAGCEVTDKRKIMGQFEKEFDEWLKNRPTNALGTPVIDPAFAKELPKNLHSILKSAGNKMKLDGLVTVYAMKTERGLDEESTDMIRGQIRAYCYTDHAFSVGRGGMATVYRVEDEKGKATGVEVTEPTSNKSGTKVVERFSDSVRKLGYTNKAQFEQAKRAAGGSATYQHLQDWIAKNRG